MASTPTETSTEQSSPPTLEELTRQTARTLLLPYIIDYVASATPSPQSREVFVIVNSRTMSILAMIESGANLEALLGEKIGPLPASQASIDAMPVVEVNEEGLECAICLAEFDAGGAKEMPCKHRYHAGCIEKWLGMRGSCPMCRYNMPVEERDWNNMENGNDGAEAGAQVEEGEGEEGERTGRAPSFFFHVYFTGRRYRRQRRHSETETDPNWNPSGDDETGDENLASSAQAMEIDSEPTSEET